MKTSLLPLVRKVGQCLFLFFGLEVVGVVRRFLGALPELVGPDWGALATAFRLLFILDQNSSVDCRNSSAVDIDIDALLNFEAPLAAEHVPMTTAVCAKMFHPAGHGSAPNARNLHAVDRRPTGLLAPLAIA